jgi:non-heme chloroperoxidase
LAIKRVVYKGVNFSLSYTIVNPKEKKTILFLHGWGSSKAIMQQAFVAELPEFRHLYLDLPGFGESENSEVLDSDDYVAIVKLFLNALESSPEIIAGHSYGGKIATRLAPKTLVLLSSAGILEEKPLNVKAKIALFKLLKPFGGSSLRQFFASKDVQGMKTNMYETLKNVVDEDYRNYFSSYKGKALIFWGEEDRATTLSSGEEISRLIEKSIFTPLRGDHFFFLQHATSIANMILLEQKR